MNTNQNYTILFWINKSKQSKGKAPIYCRITVNGRRSEISMKRSIEPNKWNSSAGRAKGNSEETRTINNYLTIVENKVFKHFNQFISEGKYITSDLLKNAFMGKREDQKTLVEAFTYHNNQMEQLIGIDVVKKTHSRFVTTLNKLKLYLEKKQNRSDLYLKELNHKFVVDFEHYLKVDEGIGHNTAMKYIRNLKKIMNMSVANDWLAKNPFNNFSCSYRKVQREILSKEELELLHKKDLTIERLAEVRDVFLFCCYTGYAFVDVEKLTPDHLVTGIDGNKWIYTNRKKTGTQSNVPLLPQAKQILDKYAGHPYCEAKGKLLPVKSNQKMNAYLKEIADICGITKKLTMHIARHTFATTVTLSNGVPIETVSRLLGHTKLATTQIYAQVLEHKVSEDMGALAQKLNNSEHINTRINTGR